MVGPNTAAAMLLLPKLEGELTRNIRLNLFHDLTPHLVDFTNPRIDLI